MCWFGDKNGTGIGRINFIAKTDGTNQIAMQARRWNTSGSAVGSFAGITIVSNRSNATTCTIDGATTISGTVTSTGNVLSKHGTIDLKSSTNGLTSNADRYFEAVDKNGYGFALFQGAAKTDGNVYVYMGVCNRDTSGTSQGWKGISITSTKAGVVSYSVTDAGAFRTAISVPSTTGSGASGSWGISVTGSSASCTGNAATATTAAAVLKRTSLTKGTNPSSTQWTSSWFNL